MHCDLGKLLKVVILILRYIYIDKAELYEKIVSVKLLVMVIVDFKRCPEVHIV